FPQATYKTPSKIRFRLDCENGHSARNGGDGVWGQVPSGGNGGGAPVTGEKAPGQGLWKRIPDWRSCARMRWKQLSSGQRIVCRWIPSVSWESGAELPSSSLR